MSQILTIGKPAKRKNQPPLVGERWVESPFRPVGDLAEARAVLSEAERVIRAQEERIRQLEDMALTDELTGLLNRRGLLLALKHEMAAARRDAHAGGMLVMIDLDGFKQINDVWGHAAGDSYLQAVGEALMHDVRESDHVARLGGDEFAVLFTHIEEQAGIDRAKKLAELFNARTMKWGQQMLPLRGSFGCSCYKGSDTPETVMASADLKLYAHKARHGRRLTREPSR